MRAIYHERGESQLPEPTRENKQKSAQKGRQALQRHCWKLLQQVRARSTVEILLGQKVLLKCNTLTDKYKTTPTQIRRQRPRILSAGFYWTRSACSRHRVTSRPPSGTQLVLAAVQQLTAGGFFESFYTVGHLDLI